VSQRRAISLMLSFPLPNGILQAIPPLTLIYERYAMKKGLTLLDVRSVYAQHYV